jgi:hypothetical protein
MFEILESRADDRQSVSNAVFGLGKHRRRLTRNNLLGSRNVALSLLGYGIYDPDELVLLGLCQEPPAAIRATACFGPHVPRL